MAEEAEVSNRSIGRAAIWATLANSSGQALTLIIFLILSRFVDPASYGAVAIALLLVECFRQFGIEAPAIAVLSKESPTDRDFSACFWLINIFGVVSALGLYFSAELIAGWMGRPDVAVALEPIAFLLVFMALWRAHEAWLSRRLMFKALFFRTLFAALFGGAVGITMGVYGYGIWALIGQQLAFASVAVIAVWSASGWRPGRGGGWGTFKEIMSFASPIGVGYLFIIVNRQVDVFIAGYVLGLKDAGIYNGAKRLGLALALILNMVSNQVALPMLARVSSDRQKMRAAFLQSFAIVSFVACPVYFGVSAASFEFVALLFGDGWQGVAPILAIIAIAGAIHALEDFLLTVFLANDRPKWIMYFNAGFAVSNVIVLLLVAEYGLIAMAIAYALRVIITFPIILYAGARLVGVSLLSSAGAIIGGLLSATGMALTVMAVREFLIHDWPVLLRFPIVILVGVAAYVVFSLIFNRSVLWEFLKIIRQVAGHSEQQPA